MFYRVFVVLSVVAFGGCIFIIKDDCPPNEEYLLCGPCPSNCSYVDPETSCGECEEGCFCTAGFLRNDNGTCVTPDQCDSSIQCADNEEFLPCSSACQPTCTQPDPLTCDFVCKTGCFCQPGFLMDESKGKCVLLDDCPPVPCLNSNEVFETCNGACEPTCYNPEPICAQICARGCVCAPGLRRNMQGECIPVEKCPNGNGTGLTLLDKYLETINRILTV